MLTLSPTRLLSTLNTPNEDLLTIIRNAVVTSRLPWFEREVEETISNFASEYNLAVNLYWDTAKLMLYDRESQRVIRLRTGASDEESYSIPEYIVLRSFFCWLSTSLSIQMGKRPELFVYDRSGLFSFSWILSREQNVHLVAALADDDTRTVLISEFSEFSEYAEPCLELDQRLNILREGEEIAHYKSEERLLTLEEVKRQTGLAVLAYYCWLNDTLERGETRQK